MSFILSFGKYGGFYIKNGKISFRVCLGWMAFTILYEDIDNTFNRILKIS